MSKYFTKANLAPECSILDIPSGTGRHSHWLADLGCHVTAFDVDEIRIARCRTSERIAPEYGSIHCVVGNANAGLPFADASFDAVLIIHFVSEGFFGRVAPLIRPGGYLVYETFGGQGQNWRDLPKPGETRDEVAVMFDILHYHERYVGPARQAVAVRLLARLKSVSAAGARSREAAPPHG